MRLALTHELPFARATLRSPIELSSHLPCAFKPIGTLRIRPPSLILSKHANLRAVGWLLRLDEALVGGCRWVMHLAEGFGFDLPDGLAGGFEVFADFKVDFHK